MRILLRLGALSLAVVAAAPVRAQAPASASAGLSLIVDTTRRDADPGSSVTLRVIVANTSGSARDFLLKTTLPDGWRLLSIPTGSRVEAKQRAIRLVQIVAPANAAAGEYRVLHSVRAVGLDADLEAKSTIVVRARRSITVALLEQPYFAASGSLYRAAFVVANHGNVPTRVRLHAKTERDVSAKIDTLTELQPGESRRVNVVVNAGAADGVSEASHHVTLLAEAEGGLSGDGKAIPEAVASVRVIPRNEGAGMPLFSLPAALSLNSTQTQQSGALPGSRTHSFELSGAGPVAEGSSSTIDFFARGPRPDRSVYGQRDEYRLGLAGPGYGLRLGDQIFAVTPLSDGGSIATGLSGHFKRGLWSGGGFASRDRTMPGGRAERAAFVGFDPNARLHLSANLVERRERENSAVGTLYARFSPTSRSIVEAEHGNGLLGTSGGASATLLRTAGDQGWLAFDLRHQQADSAYPGGARGTTQNVASITFRPITRLRLTARIADQTSPLQGGLFAPSLIRGMQRNTATSDLGIDVSGLFAAGLRTFAEGTAGLAPDAGGMSADELSGWVRMSVRLRRLSFSATTERGRSGDGTDGEKHPFALNTAQAAVRIGTHQSYSLFAEQSTGQRRYSTSPQDVVNLGASAEWQLGPLSLVATATGAPAGRLSSPLDSMLIAAGVTGWVDGSATYSLSAGRSLSLRVHSIRTGTARPVTTARIAYSMPLKLPIGRSRSAGRVMGRVYDAETGAGIANALVRIGDHSALTDDQGRVAFGAMRPDQYPVYVDLGARQSGALGFEDEALQVAARAGETTQIGVRVTRTARLTGALELYESPSGAAMLGGDSVRLHKLRGLGGVVVSLMNGSEERRVMSDADGRFELRDARPGMWRIVVPTSQLPALHYVEGDSVRVVDLAPGGSQNVTLNVLPRQRKILPLDAVPGTPAASPVALPPAPPAPAPVIAPVIESHPAVAAPAPAIVPSAPIASAPVTAGARNERTLKPVRKPAPRAARVARTVNTRTPLSLDCHLRDVFQGFSADAGRWCAPATASSGSLGISVVRPFSLR